MDAQKCTLHYKNTSHTLVQVPYIHQYRLTGPQSVAVRPNTMSNVSHISLWLSWIVTCYVAPWLALRELSFRLLFAEPVTNKHGKNAMFSVHICTVCTSTHLCFTCIKSIWSVEFEYCTDLVFKTYCFIVQCIFKFF